MDLSPTHYALHMPGAHDERRHASAARASQARRATPANHGQLAVASRPFTLETTIGFEQVAIEVTASVAQHEPDEYLAQVYRFGLLEDFDHLYRFSALMDRVMGADANNIIQNYSDIMPGRPTVVEHRAPEDDLREHYDCTTPIR